MHVIDLLNNSDRNFLEGMINNEADIIKFPGKMNVRGIKPKNPTDGEVVSLKTSPKKQALTTKDLATISDQALDRAYSYGRSVPGPNFGWLANMNSAMFAKRAIDSGETDIDRIAAEVHKGWAAAAIGDYKNKLPIDPPTPEETKLRRLRLAQVDYSSLPEKEKEKDRVVARALLQAISGREPSGNDVNEGDVVPMPARPKIEPMVNVQPASVLPFSQFRDPGTRNLERWKQQVRDRHPEYGNKIRFVSKDNGKVISAEIPGLDRSFGVFDLATEKGQVLDETGVAGPENCWPGHRKVGTQPGTGKNAGKRVNKCEKIKEQGVAEGSVNDYFKRRKDEEDRIAGTKAPAKRTPQQSDYAQRRAQEKKVQQGVAEGSNDTIYPNAEVIKSKNGKPVGEIYQDGNSWGAFHYKADRGYDFIDSREEAIEALKDLHQETGRSRPDYTIKGVAEENISELKKSTVKSYADKKQAELDDVPLMPFKKPGMSKAEHEKAAKGMMGALARLSGKKPTSKDVAETGNAFMTGIENTPEYKAGFSTGKLPVPYPEGSQQYVNYYKGVMDKAGPKGVAEGSEDNPVANAIIKRILSQRPDLLKYGADLVGDAVDEVASSVGKVQEIGTSDVSNWVRQVENYVKRAAQGNSNNLNEVSDEMLINYLTKVHQDAMKNPADPSKRSPEKRNKSVSGFNRAFNKLDARPRKDVGNDSDQAQALAPRVSEVSDVKNPGTMDHRDYIKQADELHAKMMAASQRNDMAAYEKLKAERDELDARAHKGLREEEKEGRPRIRKYSKMRPDGSKAIRYEVLDHRGIRIPGQGVEGFDDLKYAKEFYHRNYDKLQSPVEEQAQEAPTEEPIREVAGRYWCKNEKRWKNVE